MARRVLPRRPRPATRARIRQPPAQLHTLCRKHRVALVFADTAQRWLYAEDVTADFIYARLHGAEELYVSGYNDAQLDSWAARLDAWRQGGEPSDVQRIGKPARKAARRDVFVYFDNDVKVHAAFDANRLAARLEAGARSAANRTARRPPSSAAH